MSVSTFGSFSKLIKLKCTASWVSPRDRRRGTPKRRSCGPQSQPWRSWWSGPASLGPSASRCARCTCTWNLCAGSSRRKKPATHSAESEPIDTDSTPRLCYPCLVRAANWYAGGIGAGAADTLSSGRPCRLAGSAWQSRPSCSTVCSCAELLN